MTRDRVETRDEAWLDARANYFPSQQQTTIGKKQTFLGSPYVAALPRQANSVEILLSHCSSFSPFSPASRRENTLRCGNII